MATGYAANQLQLERLRVHLKMQGHDRSGLQRQRRGLEPGGINGRRLKGRRRSRAVAWGRPP